MNIMRLVILLSWALTEPPAFTNCVRLSSRSPLPAFSDVPSNPRVPGVFFYLSSAVNPVIYNLLSRRFQAAFRNVISLPCQSCCPQGHSRGPPAQRNIILTECHLEELSEEPGPQFPGQSSVCSAPLSTALCTEQAPRKRPSRWQGPNSSLPPACSLVPKDDEPGEAQGPSGGQFPL
ncbi:Neuromedin-U receptor 2 [Fukomys damarensis]|uniref:Neuromedin-U receptor 2 n=1 Tax=Fukomys damarensis TaxID=885580 RepID=A0A091D8J1_FUKDA|nr:Neuromedin-U receptor 2 [Fukomys damarensis]